MKPEFIQLDDVAVNTEIVETNFTCDLGKCKGACCTMESAFGAPLNDKEIEKIDQILDIVKEYLPKEHVKEIEKNGYWVEKYGDKMTRSLNNRACVFVYYEGEIAKCAIEKAYYDKKVDFIKPISCHLFPIRVANFGGPVLRFEKYAECQPALAKGNKTKIKIIDFCRDSLIREYGEEWFNKIKEAIGS